MGSDANECIPIITIALSRCDHSMDVGVRCLPFTDASVVPVNEIITTATVCNCQQDTTPTPMSTLAKCTPTSTEGDDNDYELSTNNRQPTATTETSHPSEGATTEGSITQSTATLSTSGILGALVGLLAAALVVVVTGWIVSCVYFQRKINK